MCLPLDSCFGFGAPRTDDDLGPPTKQVPQPSRVQRNGAAHYSTNGGGHHYTSNGAGGHYYNGTSYPVHGAAAGAEADRKASMDVRKGPAVHAVPTGAAATWGWHGGHAATGAQEKAAVYPYAGANGTLKQQPAASNGGVAQHNYYYYYERAHKEDAADFHYPAATATADHESPSEE